MVDVIVAIPSFRRPKWLERLLLALEKLETDAHVSVLVADNDSEKHEAFDLCARLRMNGYRWPLKSIIVSERGIAQARNALVDYLLTHSDAPFVAMLDDDEWPQPQWLDAFLKTQRETQADALHGAVLRVFEQTPGRWASNCEGIADLRGRTGLIDMIEGTGNVFMRRECFTDIAPPCFDPGFALTGGEDRDFFTRLRARGKRFAWADDAAVHAFVPASRARFGWALARAYRVGNSDMRVFLKHGPRAVERVRELAKIAGALLLFPPMLAILGAIPNRRAMPLAKLCRAAGKIAALFGSHYNEYATTHGE
ncbi:MAG TPA: glycosyltransferase family A protein [Rhizomicrobium sp.]|jgi:succinoglycan biosynthesis protein ExoM|nr:glycosyltransferase family A protein [Rhizomicrobium sp.]